MPTDNRMTLVISIMFIMISFSPAIASAGTGDWAMFRYDVENTGNAGSNANPPINNEILWEYNAGAEILSSPAVVDGIVYFGTVDGRVMAVEAKTGDRIWSTTVSSGTTIESSPTVTDKVYIGANNGYLYALDRMTGEVQASFKTGDAIKSSPMIINGDIFVGSYDERIYKLDSDLNKIWEFAAKYYIHATPAYKDGVVYIGSCDKQVYALDASSGSLSWSYDVKGYIGASLIILDDVLYVETMAGQVIALDITTRTENWRTYFSRKVPLGGEPNGIQSSPAIEDDMILLVNNVGEVAALDLATGDEKWYKDLDSGVISSPAISGGTMVFGDEGGTVHALDAANGQIQWTYDTGGSVDSSPAIYNGVTYVGSKDGHLYAIGTMAPVVTILEPEEWAKVKGKETIRVMIEGQDVERVEFLVDGMVVKNLNPSGEVTFDFDFSDQSAGTLQIGVRAKSPTGTGSDEINVIVERPDDDPIDLGPTPDNYFCISTIIIVLGIGIAAGVMLRRRRR